VSADDFRLPAALETMLEQVCAAQGVAPREHDAIRALVAVPPATWPACCGAACRPCVEEQKSLAREILARCYGLPVART
jgi:hypothetical protein